MRRLLSTLMFLLVACLPSGAALAATEPPASEQPIHVVADKLEVDDAQAVATFTGNVRAVQGDMTLLGDKLLVYYTRDDDKKDQKKAAPAAKPEKKAEKKKAGSTEEGLTDAGAKVRKVVAIGHVKITQKDRVGVGRQATYWAGGRKLLLEGQATVWKQKNQVSGEKITVFLDTNRTVVHGRPGRRVSVTIVPGSFNKNQDKK